MKSLSSNRDPSIETTQIGPSQDCWGCGCCFLDPFKYCLQSAISRFFNIEVNQNVIRIYDNEKTKKVVVINGFGTGVFGNEMKNVFLDPNKIKPKQIAYFINQLIKAYDKNTSDDLSVFNTLCSDKENMKFFACSSSAGSSVALSSFLKNQNDTAKKNFFKEVVAKLFPLANEEQRLELGNNAQKLMGYIAKEVNFVNPPGILFHTGAAKFFDLKLQSLAVGEQGLASEQYFIKMISVYLSGGFKLCHSYGCHDGLPKFDNDKNALISSVTDEIVFPFYYVAMFAEELKFYNVGDDKKISEFVYKVMQYGDVNNADQIKKYCDEILQISTPTHKNTAETFATNYLKIRDKYLSLQLEFNNNQSDDNWEVFKKKATEIFEEHESTSNQSASCQETFINMISEYLSGDFQLCVNKTNAIDSSVTDEIVSPFYYVAKFAEELKFHNVGDDEKISEFVYKVMQYGDVNNADQIKKYFDEIFQGSSTAHKNTAETFATNYLKIRDQYLSLQLEFNNNQSDDNREVFKKKATEIFKEHESKSKPSAICKATRFEDFEVSDRGI